MRMRGIARRSCCDSWRRLTILGLLAVAMFGAGYVVATSTGGSPVGPQASVAAPAVPFVEAQKPAEPTPAPVAAAPKGPTGPKADKEISSSKTAKKAQSPSKATAASTPKPAPAAPRPPAARYQPSAGKLGALASTLQTARSQIELYCLQHQDRYPTLAQLQQDWAALTKPTDAEGKVMKAAGRATFGPYLRSPPVNPITNSSKVAAPGQATPEIGWTYDEQTGAIKAVLPSNVLAPDLDAEGVERVPA